jgi:Flp pilus assembly protein TadB
MICSQTSLRSEKQSRMRKGGLTDFDIWMSAWLFGCLGAIIALVLVHKPDAIIAPAVLLALGFLMIAVRDRMESKKRQR